jgi:hypothetical protein
MFSNRIPVACLGSIREVLVGTVKIMMPTARVFTGRNASRECHDCVASCERAILFLATTCLLRTFSSCSLARECVLQFDGDQRCSVFAIIALAWVLCATCYELGSVWTFKANSKEELFLFGPYFTDNASSIPVLPGSAPGDDQLPFNGMIRFIREFIQPPAIRRLVGDIPYWKMLDVPSSLPSEPRELHICCACTALTLLSHHVA